MSLNIKNEETHRRAQELARATGESMTAAVDRAIQERLERVRQPKSREQKLASMRRIAKEIAALPVLDKRSPDEMLYDKFGLPK